MSNSKITKDTFHYLEIYYYKLVMYTQSDDFWKNLSVLQRGEINYEISHVAMYLKVLSQLVNSKQSSDKPIIAWPKNEENTSFTFSCVQVASEVLGVSTSKILAVCSGKQKTTEGYIFMYEDQYNSNRI